MPEIAFFRIQNAEDFAKLRRALKDAGRGDLQRQMLREIRRVGTPATTAAQRGFRSVDVGSESGGGTKSTGLRQSIAQATTIRIVAGGISIRVEPRRMDNRHRPWGTALAMGVDGLGSWRHPVFGNMEIWRQNTGTEVFYRSIQRYEPDFRRGVEKAMDDTARKLMA